MFLLTKCFIRQPINLTTTQRLLPVAKKIHHRFNNSFKMNKLEKFSTTRPGFEEANDFSRIYSLERLQKCFTPKSINSTRVVSMHRAITEENNAYMKGGDILSRIDLIASHSIGKLGGLFVCPTRSMDAIHFLVPVKRGSLLIFKSHINRVWNTSLEVAVSVETDDGISGLRHFKGPLDGDGKLRLPQVYPVGNLQERCFEESHRRRTERLKNSSSTNQEISSFRSYVLNDPRARENTSFCETTEFVLPTYANAIESTFGGQIMKWMENCAEISAWRLTKDSCMMSAGSDAIQFVKPSKVGDTMVFRSVVTRSFNTSMEVYVVVSKFQKGSENEVFTNDGFFTFVKKEDNADGSKDKGSNIVLSPSNKEEESMYNSAEKRRKARLTDLQMYQRAKI